MKLQYATTLQRYGVRIATQIPEIAAKCRPTHAKSVAFDGTKLDSSYELKVYEYCIENNVPFERQVPVEYKYKGKQHFTFIDFKIKGRFVECKGGHLLAGNIWAEDVPTSAKLPVYLHNDVIILTDKEGLSLDLDYPYLYDIDNYKSIINRL